MVVEGRVQGSLKYNVLKVIDPIDEEDLLDMA
jgi:hypothetical protein